MSGRPAALENGVRLVSAKTLWAMVDLATGRPRRVPREIRSAFEAAVETHCHG